MPLKNTSLTTKSLKKPIKQHEELRGDPQYRHVVHKGKDARINKQLLKEGDIEIKEFLRGSTTN